MFFWKLVPIGSVVLVLSSASIRAQPVGAPAVAAITSEQHVAALDASRALFKKGDIAGGEAELFSVNRHAAGTAEWHCDSGRSLALLASAFRQDGDGPTAAKLAEAALAELRQAQGLAAGNSKLMASVDTLTGFVQERLLGAPQLAELSYQAAVQASPAAAKTAAAALARLQARDAFVNQHAAKPGAN